MAEIVHFNCDKFSIIEDDPRFLKCKFFFGLIGKNYNGSTIEKEDWDDNKEFVGYTPICGYFKGYDFDEHHQKEYPLGTLLSNEDCDYHYEEYNGNLYATATGIIVKEYLPKESENILKSGEKKISVEIEVKEKEKLPDGYFRFKKFILQCVTILGDKYQQGMESAHLEVIDNPREKYATFINNTIEKFAKKDSSDNEITNFPNKGDNKAISLRNSKYKLASYPFVKRIKDDYPEIWKKAGSEDSTPWSGDKAFDAYENIRSGNMGENEEEWIVRRERFFDRFYNNAKNFKGVLACLKWMGYPEIGKAESHKIIKEEMKKVDEEKRKEKMSNNSEDFIYSSFDLNKQNKNEGGSEMIKYLNKANEKFGLNSSQIIDLLDTSLSEYKYKNGDYEYRKYWVSCFDDEYVYAYDNEKNCMYMMAYAMEGTIVKVDFDSMKKCISAGYMPIEDDKEVEEIDYVSLKSQYEDMACKYEEMSTKYNEVMTEKETMSKEFESKQDSIITMGKELETMKAEMEKMKADMEKANEEMAKKEESIAEYAKKEKEMMAEKIISQYSEKLTDEEQESFKAKVHEFSDMELYKKEIKSFVCDKFEDELKGKSTNASFSYLGVINKNINQPTKGTNWTDYIDEYKNKINN